MCAQEINLHSFMPLSVAKFFIFFFGRVNVAHISIVENRFFFFFYCQPNCLVTSTKFTFHSEHQLSAKGEKKQISEKQNSNGVRIIFIRCVRKCDSFKFTSCTRVSSPLRRTKPMRWLWYGLSWPRTKNDTVAICKKIRSLETYTIKFLRALRSY